MLEGSSPRKKDKIRKGIQGHAWRSILINWLGIILIASLDENTVNQQIENVYGSLDWCLEQHPEFAREFLNTFPIYGNKWGNKQFVNQVLNISFFVAIAFFCFDLMLIASLYINHNLVKWLCVPWIISYSLTLLTFLLMVVAGNSVYISTIYFNVPDTAWLLRLILLVLIVDGLILQVLSALSNPLFSVLKELRGRGRGLASWQRISS